MHRVQGMRGCKARKASLGRKPAGARRVVTFRAMGSHRSAEDTVRHCMEASTPRSSVMTRMMKKRSRGSAGTRVVLHGSGGNAGRPPSHHGPWGGPAHAGRPTCMRTHLHPGCESGASGLCSASGMSIRVSNRMYAAVCAPPRGAGQRCGRMRPRHVAILVTEHARGLTSSKSGPQFSIRTPCGAATATSNTRQAPTPRHVCGPASCCSDSAAPRTSSLQVWRMKLLSREASATTSLA